MYRRNDPRLRRTLNQLSQNIESANESAQVNLFTFSQRYIAPCFSVIGDCLESCASPCFPSQDERRRQRGRLRARAELNFDFYDDWENEDNDGLLGWGNDELDRLITGSNAHSTFNQPNRPRAMSYGTRRDRDNRIATGRLKSTLQSHDNSHDPTIIPSSSYFGFLGRLPWKIGGKGLKYKPSAADLTEHPGISRIQNSEEQPLIEDSDEDWIRSAHTVHQRPRSHTAGSGYTVDSFSSRGDIFPSEDEDDAVPIDDEFATTLERRTTSIGGEETHSSQDNSYTHSQAPYMSLTDKALPLDQRLNLDGGREQGVHQHRQRSLVEGTQSLVELDREEEQARLDEESGLQVKRDAALHLAIERGLSSQYQLQHEDHTAGTIGCNDPEPVNYPMAMGDVQVLIDENQDKAKISPLEFPSGTITQPCYNEPNDATLTERPLQAETDDVKLLSSSPSASFVPARLPSFTKRPP